MFPKLTILKKGSRKNLYNDTVPMTKEENEAPNSVQSDEYRMRKQLLQNLEAMSPASQPFSHPASPLNSFSSSGNQPSSTPSLVAASLQARRLAYYLLKGSAFRRERPSQVATGRNRPPQGIRLSGLCTI